MENQNNPPNPGRRYPDEKGFIKMMSGKSRADIIAAVEQIREVYPGSAESLIPLLWLAHKYAKK